MHKWPFPWLPAADISQDGWRADGLFWYTTTLGVIAFTLVTLALVYSAWKYRASAGARALYTHGTDRKSFAVTGVLAAIVFVTIDMNLVRVSQHDIQEATYNWPTAKDTVRVEVMPQQWAWNVRYAGPDGKFNTDDDIVTFNDMRVPVGHPVMLNLKAKDVIHSFYSRTSASSRTRSRARSRARWFEAREDRAARDRLRAALRLGPLQDEGRPHRPVRRRLRALDEGGRGRREAPVRSRRTRSSSGAGSGCSEMADMTHGAPPLRRSRLPRRTAHPPRADVLHPEVRLLDRPQGHRQAVPLGRPPLPRLRRRRWR